jgi:hypothetical protein
VSAETTVETREIVCASEEAARQESQRQQADEDDVRAEWIYLRNTEGVWVARRVARDSAPKPTSFKRALLEWLTNPFDWLKW